MVWKYFKNNICNYNLVPVTYTEELKTYYKRLYLYLVHTNVLVDLQPLVTLET